MFELSPDDLRALRTHAQCLDRKQPRGALADVVRGLVGVQAQLAPAMLLALRARIGGLEAGDVEAALTQQHSLARTWVMRGTLHLVAADDIHWLTGLLGPVFAAKDQRRRQQLGIDEKLSKAGLSAIREILADGSALTRHELVAKLAERGVQIEPKGQAPIHLIAQAALEGIVCLGPDRPGGKASYVLLDKWITPREALPRQAALAELARRYLAGYGPAEVKDFAGWSGLSLADAHAGWQGLSETDKLIEVRVEGRSLWTLTEPDSHRSTAPVVRLLPAFDTYVLGYANRDDLILPQQQREVYHGGQTVPVVLVDGLAAGVWRYDRQGKRLKITVRTFDTFSSSFRDLIAEEAIDIGRFWDVPVSVTMDAGE
ncbi:MAG: AlkZ family DNA glycosylase [Chloroflexi bacterium]|nr:AlkZ family DNA glycosylase [Chloroflexota bacterium]